MDFNALLKGRSSCSCGMNHQCSTEAVIIKEGAVDYISSLCGQYGAWSVITVFDSNTFGVCGRRVNAQLENAGINHRCLVYEGEGLLVPDEAAVRQLEEKLLPETELIIGVGSGVINDICKYTAGTHNIPYIIVATAPSMDGYASTGAAMIFDGRKVTVNVTAPKAILGDTNILASAPIDMIRAGLGDMIGKLSALNDWRLSSLITGEHFCTFTHDLVLEAAENAIAGTESIINRDKNSINKLMEGLVAVGIAMSYMGNSRPASGSEHHLSHFYEVVSLIRGREYLLHGIDVAFSTAVTCFLRHKLKECDVNDLCYRYDKTAWEKNIRHIYGGTAQGIISMQERSGLYNNHNLNIIKRNWESVKELLGETPGFNEVTDILSGAGLDIRAFFDLYGSKTIRDSIVYAKDLKERYSVLWLLADTGLLEKVADEFQKYLISLGN